MTEVQKKAYVRRVTNQLKAERRRCRIEKAVICAKAILLGVVYIAIFFALFLIIEV